MNNTDLTSERRRELVLAAIDRIKHLDANRDAANLNPRATPREKLAIRDALTAAESEFAWQWRNVEALLRG